jgi:peptidoglycan/xylan/chitin deacetylase (PgdA/CDA1 family)
MGLSLYFIVVLVVPYLAITIYGSSVIQANYFLRSANKGNPNSKSIAITFDDGPTQTKTEEVLNILKAKNIPAAFFLIGNNIAGKEALLKRMDTEGHIIGNHSFSHNFWFSIKPADKMLADLNQCTDLIKMVIGKQTLLFRPPYGVTNPRVAKAVKAGSYISVGWSLRTFDTNAKNKQALLKKALNNLKGGDVLLFHDWGAYTVDMLADFIDAAKLKGFNFVRADELLDIKAYI